MKLSNIQYDLWVEVLKVLDRKKISQLYRPVMKQCKLTIQLDPKEKGLKPVELNLFLNAFEKIVPYLEAAIFKEEQKGNLHPMSNEKGLTAIEKGVFELYPSDIKLLLYTYKKRNKVDLKPVYDAFFKTENLTPASFVAWYQNFTGMPMLYLVDAIMNLDNDNLIRLLIYLGVVCDKVQKLRETYK